MDSRKCHKGGGQLGKGRVESGSGVKEDFWEEVGFDSKLKSCITEILEK